MTGQTLAEVIAVDLTRGGFIGWLLNSGNSALWASRTPEQETGRVVADAVTAHLAAILADPETVEAVSWGIEGSPTFPAAHSFAQRDILRGYALTEARAAIAVIASRLGVAR